MIIKEIPNEDFLDLVKLNIDMYKEIDPTINAFGATYTLTTMIASKSDFIAIGIYTDNDELIGFLDGYQVNKKEFYFCGIYVIIRNNGHAKKLFDFAFALIKSKGYSAWSGDTANSNISYILEKYGAKVKSTKYYQEFV